MTTLKTTSVRPSSLASSLPASRSQMRRDLSLLPDTESLPLGAKAIVLTASLWPSNSEIKVPESEVLLLIAPHQNSRKGHAARQGRMRRHQPYSCDPIIFLFLCHPKAPRITRTVLSSPPVRACWCPGETAQAVTRHHVLEAQAILCRCQNPNSVLFCLHWLKKHACCRLAAESAFSQPMLTIISLGSGNCSERGLSRDLIEGRTLNHTQCAALASRSLACRAESEAGVAAVSGVLELGAESRDVGHAPGDEHFGHEAACTTIHANSVRDAVQRIEDAMVMMAAGFAVKAIRQQFAPCTPSCSAQCARPEVRERSCPSPKCRAWKARPSRGGGVIQVRTSRHRRDR